jgi:lon-related putative ATP-dependent protease
MARILTPEELCKGCDTKIFRFGTTEDLEPLFGMIGQDRALGAIDFGLHMTSLGFNIFALGDSGTGKTSAIRSFIMRKAQVEPVPRDWVYVHNFKKPDEPIAVSLDPGMGAVLQRDMADLTASLRAEIPKIYESKEYKDQRTAVIEEFQRKQKEIFGGLEAEAEVKGFNIRAQAGEFTIVPVGPSGEPITEEEFRALDESRKARIREEGRMIRERLDEAVRAVKKEERATKAKIDEIDRNAALSVLGYLIEEVRIKYRENEKLMIYLDEVKEDVLENLGDFKAPQEEPEAPPLPFLKLPRREPDFTRYAVNAAVNNGELKGSPCVFESNPTYYNLFGRIEHRFQMGAALTDFTMIKAGSLHRANGGYLVLNALDLLRNLFSYEAIKRAVRNAEVRIEDVWEQYRPVPTTMMRPEPIPLRVKIILIGRPEIYYLLYNLDEEYRELFKVKADFDSRIDRSEENVMKYATFIATKAREEKLLPFDPSGVGKIVEYGSRMAGHQEKLTSRFSDIANLIREAHFWSKREGASTVTAACVEKAWNERAYRHGLIEDYQKEVMLEGTLIVESSGRRVGQVNGLAVIDLGDHSFGKPSRITATVHTGKAGVVNIERETKLSGRIHDKAVLILANYLAARFAARSPINLSASLTFEQLYGLIEGDSATCAELYALLSALSGVPVAQNVAVTGSMDQNGTVQPIGGVNEKIEGFFDLCRMRGLDGTQGVLVPRRNIRHLMLKRDVIDAVRERTFRIYAIERVEEGIEILMGLPAGEPGPDRVYPEGTIYRLVADRLDGMREAVREERGKELEAAKRDREEEEEEEEKDS